MLIYIYVYMYTYIYIYTHVYLNILSHAYTHVCIFVYTYYAPIFSLIMESVNLEMASWDGFSSCLGPLRVADNNRRDLLCGVSPTQEMTDDNFLCLRSPDTSEISVDGNL